MAYTNCSSFNAFNNINFSISLRMLFQLCMALASFVGIILISYKKSKLYINLTYLYIAYYFEIHYKSFNNKF